MEISDATRALDRDLRELFGARLRSVVAYGSEDAGRQRSESALAIVDSLTADDLLACASHALDWQDSGLATPLLVAAHEFGRSLDAFPFEFGTILANYTVVSGADPFAGLRVEPADFRRACEVQARSHLLHLREGYIETGNRGDAVAELIRRSAAPLAALMQSVTRLQGANHKSAEAAGRHLEGTLALKPGSLTDVVKLSASTNVSADEARRMFPPYLHAVEALTSYIDRWHAS
jgi:hypothetical protein